MIYVFLVGLGLALGSFVNALVWRVHEQSKKRRTKGLSVLNGRSMCPHCKHVLAAKDLVPVFSWLVLGGKCRYCHKPISVQYPLVELLTAGLFIASYLFWPFAWDLHGIVNFGAWLVILTGFIALIVYDIRWMLLPNRIIYPLIGLASALAVFNLVSFGTLSVLLDLVFGVMVAGGIFYLLFTISKGRWIGGGDVKLGFLIGLILTGGPAEAFLVLLLASSLGTVFVLPGLLLRKVTTSSRIPFGPFLIIAAILVKLFGAAIVEWYRESLMLEV